MHFKATSNVEILDTLIIISIKNIDSLLMPFSFVDTFKTECYVVENFIQHKILDRNSGEKVGIIGFEGDVFSYVFKYLPCPNSTSFEGGAE
ncbi:MAG: hypothetical protein M3R25_06250 [Bacteroidota bacterium]|nr:hypothetical protein [Bacteroidota bacterium]